MVTINPTDSIYKVPYKEGKITEFEIQSFIFEELKKRNINVKGEVVWREPELKIQCRFDLVIYDEAGVCLEILEIKDTPSGKHKNTLADTRQGRRYPLFGVPVTFIYGMEEAIDFIKTY